MKKAYLHIVLVIVFSLLIACDNENSLECLKKSGNPEERVINLDPFERIVVMDEADIFLVPGERQHVVVKGGKNILSDIKFNVSDETLTITNENKCLWVRDPGNPGIYITCPDLREIEIFDYVNFYAQDTLRYDYLQVFSDGTGNFEMALQTDSLFINSIYISNFRIAGSTDYLNLHIINDGRFDGADLISDFNIVYHKGSNLIELYPVKSLKGKMQGTGSVKYYHTPEIIDVTIQGTGRLIDLSGDQ